MCYLMYALSVCFDFVLIGINATSFHIEINDSVLMAGLSDSIITGPYEHRLH